MEATKPTRRTKDQEMATPVARAYQDWKQRLVMPSWESLIPWGTDDPTRLEAIVNRQVALAILVDLEYCQRISWVEIKDVYTGKSAAHWNFHLLGVTEKLDKAKSYRKEAKTSDLFVITILNKLHEQRLAVDWDKLEEALKRGRYRVHAIPAELKRATAWARTNHRDGIDYPCPWDVANRCGHEDKNPTALSAQLAGKYGWPRPIVSPCRIKRVDIAYHVGVQCGSSVKYPSVLQGWSLEQERARFELFKDGIDVGLTGDEILPEVMPKTSKKAADALRNQLPVDKPYTRQGDRIRPPEGWMRIRYQGALQEIKELTNEVDSLKRALEVAEDAIRQMQQQISRMHSDEKRAMLALGRIYEIAKGQVDTGKSDDDVLRRWIETGE